MKPVVSALLVVCGACSSSSPGGGGGAPCNQDPFACPAGQTCWVTTSNTFACLASKAGAGPGSSCTPATGSAPCGDSMLCYEAPGASAGACIPYCDPIVAGHGCAANSICRSIEIGAAGSVNGCVALALEDAGPG